MKTHQIRSDKWYVEYAFLTKYEQALLHIGLQLPTPKDKTFHFGLALFTLSLFYIEVHRMDKKKRGPTHPIFHVDALEYMKGE